MEEKSLITSFEKVESSFHNQPLYGGAIFSKLHDAYMDISNLREVPDHQEVFVDNNSDNSLIVELFDYEANLTDEAAIEHYFTELATFNESKLNAIITNGNMTEQTFCPSIPAQFPRIALIGKQSASKFKARSGSEVDEFYVILVLIRLANVGTDMLISLNIPRKKAQNSTVIDFEKFEQTLHLNLLLESEYMENMFEKSSSEVEFEGSATALYEAIKVFKTFVNSLSIIDWSLFL
jgi:hypothetical protein